MQIGVIELLALNLLPFFILSIRAILLSCQ